MSIVDLVLDAVGDWPVVVLVLLAAIIDEEMPSGVGLCAVLSALVLVRVGQVQKKLKCR